MSFWNRALCKFLLLWKFVQSKQKKEEERKASSVKGEEKQNKFNSREYAMNSTRRGDLSRLLVMCCHYCSFYSTTSVLSAYFSLQTNEK
jgi:hypothetical protein